MPFVVDASVALTWYFEDEVDPYAEIVLDRLQRDDAIATALLALEVANGLAIAERRSHIPSVRLDRIALIIEELPITIDETPLPRVFGPILGIARRTGLTCYDASYLELAIRRGVPLATRDVRLRNVATEVDVQLVECQRNNGETPLSFPT